MFIKIKTTEPGTAPKNPADVSFSANPIQVNQQNSYGSIFSANQHNYQKIA